MAYVAAGLVLVILAGVGVGVRGEQARRPVANGASISVVKIVDGDTIDVKQDGQITRIRLLNIDTPEMKGADGSPECGATAAKAALQAMLPIGSEVGLRYDAVRADRYGRTLAVVTDPSGVSTSRLMASAGWGGAASYGDDVLYLSEVRQADTAAQEGHVGLYDPALYCSPIGTIESLEAQATLLAADDAAGAADIFAAVVDATETVTASALPSPFIAYFLARLAKNRVLALVPDPAGVFTVAQVAEAKRIEQERAVAAEQEAARIAAEQEAVRVAAEQEAARVAAEEQRVRNEQEAAQAEAARVAEEEARRIQNEQAEAEEQANSPSDNSGSDESDDSPTGGADDLSGYTGPRCYAPGGQTWTPC